MELYRQERGMFRMGRMQANQSRKGFALFLVGSCAVTGWMWFLFFSGYWDVRTVEMEGIHFLNRGEVETEVYRILDDVPWRPWHKKNALMIDPSFLAQKLQERLFVDFVVVEKSYPDILRLKIKERQRSVVLVSQEQFVTVDANGVVTGQAEGEVLTIAQDRLAARTLAREGQMPVVVMNTADPVVTGFEVAKPEQMRRWLEATRLLVLGGMKIRFMKVDTPESVLGRFVSEKGYDIYVDLTKPIDEQAKNYLAFLKTKPDESKITAYVDVRIPGKVFLK